MFVVLHIGIKFHIVIHFTLEMTLKIREMSQWVRVSVKQILDKNSDPSTHVKGTPYTVVSPGLEVSGRQTGGLLRLSG